MPAQGFSNIGPPFLVYPSQRPKSLQKRRPPGLLPRQRGLCLQRCVGHIRVATCRSSAPPLGRKRAPSGCAGSTTTPLAQCLRQARDTFNTFQKPGLSLLGRDLRQQNVSGVTRNNLLREASGVSEMPYMLNGPGFKLAVGLQDPQTLS